MCGDPFCNFQYYDGQYWKLRTYVTQENFSTNFFKVMIADSPYCRFSKITSMQCFKNRTEPTGLSTGHKTGQVQFKKTIFDKTGGRTGEPTVEPMVEPASSHNIFFFCFSS